MMVSKERWMPWLVAAALLGGVACGSDSDDTENDAGEQTSDAGDGPEFAEEPAFAASYNMRFTEFAFDAGTPGAFVNGPIERFLDQDVNYPVVVLVEMEDIDVSAGTLQIRGGAGLKTGTAGEYRWDGELDVPEFTEGSISTTGELDATLPLLNFVATVEANGEVNKTIIPIRDLTIAADLQATASGEEPTIKDGTITGYVVLEDIADVGLAVIPGGDPTPLSQLFGGADSVNYDYDEDGEDDSWELRATFSATQTLIVE
ncbi:hypothetical protein DL240_03410 [Lujinxingia litoralis]|uniref:Uncharacterized protein n=1 Tax=Lujinxingia litoralis TaxID=2211119 RepID=A0A328CEE1_9DELT|nr:hypothetical protein [Lujinxingia litoralis]RAL25273.1 hypothetical protein DL240_03410 [Lujinxingia litoralis]